jgi:SAM-dependent methyltransferase
MLSRNRDRLEADLAGSSRRAWMSPVTLGLDAALRRVLGRSARGVLLDAGCGTMPYRAFLSSRITSYIALDIERRADGVALIGDVQGRVGLAGGSADVILCSEVLEHLSKPESALSEFHRILRPAGTLILSTPFLARIHEAPNDYFRFTRYGLQALLERNGFRLVEVEATGGVFAFLGHQPATVLCSLAWPVPMLRDIVLGLVALGITLPCRLLDRVLGSATLFPAGYVVRAERSAESR